MSTGERAAGSQRLPPPEPRLVAAIDRLFERSSLMHDERGMIFTTGIRAVRSKAAVLAQFTGLPTGYSSWKKAKLSHDKRTLQLTLTRRLLRIFQGDAIPGDISKDASPEIIQRLYKQFAQDPECTDICRGLTNYSQLLENIDRASHAAAIESQYDESRKSAGMVSGVFSPPTITGAHENRQDPLPIPPDLLPPPRQPQIERSELLVRLQAATEKYYILAVEGIHGSGKTFLVTNFIVTHGSRVYRQILWYRPTTGADLSELFVVFGDLIPESKELEVSRIIDLFNWLTRNEALLVIDDFERADWVGYTAFIQLASRRIGRTRLILVSHNHIDGKFDELPLLDVGGFTQVEARAFLVNEGLDPNQVDLASVRDKSGLVLPYFVLAAAQIYKSDQTFLQERFVQSFRVQRWLEKVLSDLEADELLVLEHLALCDEPFDEGLIRWVIGHTGSNLRSNDLTASLTRPLLLARHSTTHWKLQEPLVHIVRQGIDESRCRKMYAVIGDYYFRPWNGVRWSEIALGYDDLLRLSMVCSFFQKAEDRFLTKKTLLNRISRPLRQQGLHRILIPLLQADVQSNRMQDPWLEIRLANSYLTLGDTRLAFDLLEPLTASVLFGIERPAEMRVTVARALAEALLYSGYHATALSLLVVALHLFEPASLPFNVLQHAKSVLVWAYLKAGSLERAISINEEVINDTPPGDRIALGVARMRMGMARIDQGQIKNAVHQFELAREFFLGADQRGFVWSSLYLAYAYSLNEMGEDMEAALSQALYVNSSRGFVGEDYLWIFGNLRPRIASPQCADLVEAEIKRLLASEEKRHLTVQQVRKIEALDVRLRTMPGSVSDHDRRFLRNDRVRSNAGMPQLSSRLYRSYIRIAASKGATEMIRGLFEENSPKKVLSTLLFSHILTESAKRDGALVAEYILPHIDILEHCSERIKLHYARFFYQIGDTPRALRMLSLVKNKMGFTYASIMADCLVMTDFDAAEQYYNMAARRATRPQQKARILANLAFAIHKNRRRDRYDHAITYCREAMSLWRSRRFQLPRKLLVALEIETCEWENIALTLETLRAQLAISRAMMRRICGTVHDLGRKRRAFEVLTS